MFFKSMEIQGFKSFADKTILNFDTKTTAVVGSNGNGKSNISDALRWVMGEQSTKTLRGDKMEDVIFHGTTTRKAMSFARVSLYIDNSDRRLDVNADEVVICRKLYRSGDSEFFINDKKSRLKDIQELLLGTGLGRDGYSIVGQGRVAEIVNARGTQRREIFEEAAGVSLFLHKKRDAERSLQQAEENILRQKDIIQIDEERLPVLKKQSEKAVLAAELLNEKKQLDISVSVAQISEKKDSLKEIEEKILLFQAECENFDKDNERLELRIEEASNERLGLMGDLDRIRRSHSKTKDEIAEHNSEIAVLKNDIRHNDERINEINEKISHAEDNALEYDRQIEELKNSIEENEKAIQFTDEQIKIRSLEFDETSVSEEAADKEKSDMDSRLGKLYLKQSEAKISITQAERSKTEATEQLSAFMDGFSGQNDILVKYKDEISKHKNRKQEISSELSENENKFSGYNRLMSTKETKLSDVKRELDELNGKYTQASSRFNVLSDIDKNMQGYGNSVKELIQCGKSGRIGGIHGAVADLVHVEAKYVVAMETALGGILQNIVVDNEETAKRCIRHLKETNSGRATMLPITSVKGNSLYQQGLEDEDGFEGLAHELVDYDEKYDGIIKYALGKTVIVDDVDTASRIAKKYGYKFKIVSLDGQVTNVGGSYTGGSVTKSGIISRKQEIESLGDEVQRLKDKTTLVSGGFRSMQAEVTKLSIEIEGIKENIQSLKNEEVRCDAEISRLESLISQTEEQKKNAQTTIDRFNKQILDNEITITYNKEKLLIAEKEIIELEEKLSLTSAEREAKAVKIKMLSEMMSRLEIEKITLAKDIETIKSNIRNIEQNKENLASNGERFIIETEQLEQKNAVINEQIAAHNKKIKEIESNLTDNSKDMDDINQKCISLEREMEALRKQTKELSEHKQHFTGELARYQERRENVQREYDSTIKALYDGYAITLSEAKELAKPLENMLMAQNDLLELNRKIKALGSVNMDSVEEYLEVLDRYNFLTSQLNDIEKAKHDLEKLIEELTNDIKTRFLNSFIEINRHFKEIFVQIFGEGAHAELELTDPDDVLNSGIEIKAAPPGKVIKNLISLSGGEQTMVAVTIYFAILRHRPTPFCMLDEVDAALDEANVEKYISYLRQFSNNTQLMVITHRRGTIEGCDVLYGVFMQEKGVSRLLRQEIIENLDLELD